jgi:hypothetical protein
MSNRLRQSAFGCPPASQAEFDELGWQPCLSAPLGDCHCSSLHREPSAASPIVGLLDWRTPAHIAWFVVAVIVGAFKRMHWTRLRSHVGQERFKRLPAFAHHNPASAVPAVFRILRVVAAPAHQAPGHVFRCSGTAVRRVAFNSALATQTSARSRVTARQVCVQNSNNGSAIASADPLCLRRPCRTEPHNRQTSKTSTDVIWKRQSHARILTGIAPGEFLKSPAFRRIDEEAVVESR